MNIKIMLPQSVSTIIHVLMEHGFEAYAVGGCVRDSILGKEPADWDITTSAKPAQVKALFPRTIDTGLKHGTVTILMDRVGYEVTTYRIDGVYTDHRRPNTVTFTTNLKEDLSRRDFTINAMAYNDTTGIIDLFGGVDDLKAGIIRCVGDSATRFDEDALRMLRAIRFSAQLGFEIDSDTYQAILQKKRYLKKVSAERIQMELLKLLISDHPDRIRTAYETGLTEIFFPEFDEMMHTPQNNPHHIYSVGEHTIHAITNIEPNPILRLTMLFHDIGKPSCKTTDDAGIDHFRGHHEVGSQMSKKILRRLKFDNRTIQLVSTLIYYHDVRFKDPETTGRRNIRKLMSDIGPSLFPYLIQVMQADVSAQSTYLQDKKLDLLERAKKVSEEITAAGDCLTLKELKISGSDLKNLGIHEGKEIGSILNLLLSMVLENPKLNDFAYLKELALRIHRQLGNPTE